MNKHVGETLHEQFYAAVDQELMYIRDLGANRNLILASANQSAFEALLIIIAGSAAGRGVPVYEAVTSVRSKFSSQAGVLNRIKTMRAAGLIAETPGAKNSQVCLVPSDLLLRDLVPVLNARHLLRSLPRE